MEDNNTFIPNAAGFIVALVVMLAGSYMVYNHVEYKPKYLYNKSTQKVTTKEVTVKIEDSYYKEPEYRTDFNGHIWYSHEVESAEYIIIVKYNNELYRVKCDKTIWNKYANNVGDYADANLMITINDSSKEPIYSITELY